MKNIHLSKRVIPVVVAFCGLLVLFGCSNPLSPSRTPESEPGTGTLMLTINGAARTIVPIWREQGDFVFSLEFTAASGDESLEIGWDGQSPIVVAVGDWNLTVRAYLPGIYVDGSGYGEPRLAAQGTYADTITIQGGMPAGANILLRPIPVAEGPGMGTFAWEIDFSEIQDAFSIGIEIVEMYDGVAVSGPLALDLPSLYAVDGIWACSHPLPAGWYIVTFVLYRGTGDDRECATRNAVLRVYQNLSSEFSYETHGQDTAFTPLDFPASLENLILRSWDSEDNVWNFPSSITYRHFAALGFTEVTDANFSGFTSWLTRLTRSFRPQPNRNDLPILIAAAITGVNEDALVVLEYGLGAQFEWLRGNAAQQDGRYIVVIGAGETITPLSLPIDRTNLQITLRAAGPGHTLSLDGSGSLFWVSQGLTLVLEEDITLQGHCDNSASLVTVVDGGTLVMLDGSAITGNTADGIDGGGVFVGHGGTFNMEGGEIHGNEAIGGGGVLVVGGGTFNMGGGEIHGNEAAGGGVFVVGGTFNMSGGTIRDNHANVFSGIGTGGGVWVLDGGTFDMSAGTISYNTANYGGGGVFVDGGVFYMRGGTIFGNTTDGSGGGVHVWEAGSFNMSGGIIVGNDPLPNDGAPNYAVASGTAALYIAVGATAQYGSFANGTPGAAFTPTGALGTEDRTIEVVDGVLIRPLPEPPVIEMVRIGGGTFQMGNPSGGYANERPVRPVTLSGFYMSRFQVTQGEWYDVMFHLPGTTGGGTRRPGRFNGTNNRDGATVTPTFDWRNLPVEQVSWYDALVFSNRLSIQRGLTPAYSIGGSTNPDDWGPVPTSGNATWDAVTIVPGSTGYRLPTEAQWEFAARGGIVCQENFNFSGSNTAAEVAWHANNSGDRTNEVGRLRPNALGLYDMSGNVWEWVWDRFGNYPNVSETDPQGASLGSTRVLRGGCWVNATTALRSARRHHDDPAIRSFIHGFRLARPIPESGTAGDPFLLDAADFLRRTQANPPDWPLNARFRLTQDVTIPPGTQWTPIGNAANPFIGSFDGGGHSISGLTIAGATGDNQGMFGVIGSGAVVRDLDLVGVSINVTGNSVGALAGRNYGTVDKVSVSGSVTGGDNVVGGIVGSNRGAGSRLANSSSAADVSGVQQVGGLAGSNGGIVENSFATGRIYGSGGHAGGAVGRNESTVRSSFALGDVSGGGNNVGGLVGNNVGGAVENSFAAGDVDSSANNVGGLVGANFNGGAVENSFAAGSVSGGVRVGGIVGGNYADSRVRNSAALSPNVFGTAPASRARAAGQNDAGATLANNHANAGMLVGAPSAGTVVTAGLGPATVQGANVSPGTGTGQWNNQTWWASASPSGPVFAFYPAGPWHWCGTRNRPTLPGEL